MGETENPVPSGSPGASGSPASSGSSGAPPTPGAPEAPAPAEAPEAPVLASTPRWVPAAVVAGAVLLVEGLIVSRIRPESAEGARSLVSDVAGVGFFLGVLSLVGGYFAFLLSKVSFPRALESLALTAAAVASYLAGWWILLVSLNGDAAGLPGIKDAGLSGRTAALVAIGGVAACTAIFAVAFKWWTGLVWPHFRGWVALNVLAMLHLVVLLLGVVSFLNVRFVPKWEWATVDLTETSQFSLSDKTRAVLGKVEGEILVYAVDYGAARRTGSGIRARVVDLLRQYQAACPRMTFRSMDALRGPDELRKAFLDAGMEGLLDGLTGEEDVVVLGYRPAGEKLVVRTKVVPVNQEFAETSSLGSEKFRGEGILTNAVNEVVFAQRKVVFLEGHGERATGSAEAPAKSVSNLADALRGDNFSVSTLNLSKEPAIPADVDLVCIPGPSAPFNGGEVEALRGYLSRGGAVLLLLDVPASPDASTGLEDLLASYGITARQDAVVVSYVVERTVTRGDIATPTFEVFASRDEFGRHPAMEALRSSNFVCAFRTAVPLLHEGKAPEGVEVQDLVFAPRDIQGYRPFGARLVKGRGQDIQPMPGDITDKRLPVGVTAERRAGEGGKGGGRLVVFGDTDFATDLRLNPQSPAVVPGNRTLLLNAVSWAVRRDLIAIDPKSVDTEMVQMRSIDRDLAFWSMVVALPVLVLGVAVGMWWVRRR